MALFKAGLDIDVVNEYGQSALFLAAANGHSRTVALLISMGAVCISDNAGVYVNFTKVDMSLLDRFEKGKEEIITEKQEKNNVEGLASRENIIKEKEVILEAGSVKKEIKIIKYALTAPCFQDDLHNRQASLSIISENITTGKKRSIP